MPSSRRARSIGPTSAADAGDDAAGDVAVPVQVFRRALHRQIDAERKRLLVDRARERVVDHRQDTARSAGGRDPLDVDAAQRRVDRRLEPDDPRRIPDDALRLAELLDRDEPWAHAELHQHVVQQMERAAVDRRRTDHLVAGARVRHQRRRDGAHARREDQRGLGLIERGELPLHRRQRRVAVARVQVLRGSALVVGDDFGGAGEHEGRGLVDRGRQRRRPFADPAPLRGSTRLLAS